MKIRTALVSNSSTSSFIILGFDISKNEVAKKKMYDMLGKDFDGDCWGEITDKLQDFCETSNLCYRNGGPENGLKNGEEILGILLGEVSSDYGDELNMRMSFSDITKTLYMLREQFGITEEAQLIAGTRLS